MTEFAPERGPRGRLSLMMFLQYAVWGAWLPLLARYLAAPPGEGGLGFEGGDIGNIIGWSMAAGALTSPFIAGQLADRLFATQRVLAVFIAIGGGLLWVLAEQTSYSAWLWLSIANAVVFMPTLALSNSLAFAHLPDSDSDFPKVRVWGTLGWIAASWVFPMIWLQSDLEWGWMPPFLSGPEVEGVTGKLAGCLKFGALLSWGYAIYALVLPHTPPRRDATNKLAFAQAFALLRHRSFLTLVVIGLFISAIHQIYFLAASTYLAALGIADSAIGPVMTLAQFSEILVMACLGWGLKRLGFRAVLTIGGLAYIGKYFIWSQVDLPIELIVGGQILHGFCYACFFAASFIYVDRLAGDEIRHSAQTVYGMLILGLGPLLGSWLNGVLSKRIGDDVLAGYSEFWMALTIIAVVTTALLLWWFRDETDDLHPSESA